MPLSIEQVYSKYLSEEIPFDGTWHAFICTLVTRAGAMEFYDEESLPTSAQCSDLALEALKTISPRSIYQTLWAAAAICNCSGSQEELILAGKRAIEECDNKPLIVPVEVTERLERLTRDNPSILPRISMRTKSVIAGYIHLLLMKDMTEYERDFMIYLKLQELVHKSYSFRSRTPEKVIRVFELINRGYSISETRMSGVILRCLMNWNKNGLSEQEMQLRAMTMMEEEMVNPKWTK